MKSLIKLGLTIFLIAICFKFCSEWTEGAKEAGKQTVETVKVIEKAFLDTPIPVTEPSDDPFDKLYAVEDENSVQGKTLREIAKESLNEIKDSVK